jgi:hypothetical protein
MSGIVRARDRRYVRFSHADDVSRKARPTGIKRASLRYMSVSAVHGDDGGKELAGGLPAGAAYQL